MLDRLLLQSLSDGQRALAESSRSLSDISSFTVLFMKSIWRSSIAGLRVRLRQAAAKLAFDRNVSTSSHMIAYGSRVMLQYPIALRPCTVVQRSTIVQHHGIGYILRNNGKVCSFMHHSSRTEDGTICSLDIVSILHNS